MNVFIPITAGSEYRQFILSGIAAQILNDGHQVYTSIPDDDITLRSEIFSMDRRIKIIDLPIEPIRQGLYTLLQEVLDRNYELKHKRFSYGAVRTRKIKGKLLDLFLKFNIVNILERKINSKIYSLAKLVKVPKTTKLLSDYKISLILINSGFRTKIHSLLLAAYQLNIPIKIIFHTNKAVFAENRISFPFHSMGVWNEEMKRVLCLRNTGLNVPVVITGNTHFNYLTKGEYSTNYLHFKKDYKLRDDDLVILYTAASKVVENEQIIVKEINSRLKKKFGDNFKIIVRQNPMDDSDKWNTAFQRESNVIIQKPKWVYKKDIQLNYTKKTDLLEYKALLTYSHICINIPSTVTVEAAIMHLPIINICFHPKEVNYKVNSCNIAEFWNLPYYKQFHNLDFVIPAYSYQELISNIEKTFERHKSSFGDYDTGIKRILSESAEVSATRTLNFIYDSKH